MLAKKYEWEDHKSTTFEMKANSKWKRFFPTNTEVIIENMTNIMFKAILFFGIPYFLFVFIKFLLL